MNYFKRLLKYFLHLLWPVSCPVCGRLGVKICDECLNSIFDGEIFSFKLENLTIKSISLYNDELHEILSSFDDEELRRIYRASGFKLSESFSCPDNIDLIIPVPVNFRGSKNFNKAQEISDGLGQSWGIKVFSRSKWTDDNNFILSEKIKGCRVLLVNDTCVTGSVILKLARACEDYGAEVVCAYVCAAVKAEKNFMQEIKSAVQVLLPPYFELVPIVNKVESLEVYSAALFEDEIRSVNKFEAGLQMAEFFEEHQAEYLIPATPDAQEIAKGMSEHWGINFIAVTENISGLKVALVDYVYTDGEILRELASECERSGANVVCAYTLACLNGELSNQNFDEPLLVLTHNFNGLSMNILDGLKDFSVNSGRLAAEKFGETEVDCLITLNSNFYELAKGMSNLWNIELFAANNLEKISGLRAAIVGDDEKKILALVSECERAGAFVICAYVLANINNFHEKEIAKLFEAQPIKRIFGGGLEIFSAGFYGEEMKTLVWDFKFRGKKELCEPSGRAMAKFFVKPEIDCIIPVPLHVNSERDYNQTYEIAKGLGEIWRVKILEAAEWSHDIPKQIGLTAQERRKINPDDFIITKNISGLRVALIDDICTTGSTLRALASSCENSGAKVICAFTLASTNFNQQ